MAQIVWTEPAVLDLREIAEYIALDKPSAAKGLVKKVFSTVKRLKTFPDSGREPPELPGSPYRVLIVGPCRVFYRQAGKRVVVLYVMCSERALRRYILTDREIS